MKDEEKEREQESKQEQNEDQKEAKQEGGKPEVGTMAIPPSSDPGTKPPKR